jgi:pyruvate/2-oxoglutarate dehydrogenase complex dihydrolipoamide acyltransferase (E2) component
MDEDCVVFDLPEGLRLNVLGLVVEIERILVTADRTVGLGGVLASLFCGDGEEPKPKPKPKPKPEPKPKPKPKPEPKPKPKPKPKSKPKPKPRGRRSE